MSGIVTDVAGARLDGATVTVRSLNWYEDDCHFSGFAASDTVAVSTIKGEYTVPYAQMGSHLLVTVTKPGYRPARRIYDVIAETDGDWRWMNRWDLSLQTGAEDVPRADARGVVNGDDYWPAPGATVTVELLDADSTFADGTKIQAATSNDKGAFELKGIPLQGRLRFAITLAGYHPKVFELPAVVQARQGNFEGFVWNNLTLIEASDDRR